VKRLILLSFGAAIFVAAGLSQITNLVTFYRLAATALQPLERRQSQINASARPSVCA
jgi:hypothetical protein